ncbi:MAG TPA: LysM peptidoglycan-binding domain-containing protein [Candidatus Binatus sp.]|nr:LysM peptidoglycan-binding domain-containing protein [Candidatus Binatus sp.]
MRFANLCLRTAVLASLVLAACSCQTAQKPVSLLPPTTAPALKPTPPAAQVPTPVAKPAVAQTQNVPAQKSPSPQSPAPANGTATAQASSPTSDPVGDLVARAEKEYQAGLANHQAGKTDDAKQNFDNALNALLSSNLDVRSDDRLQAEFDRIVAGVNQLYPGGTSADADSQQEAQQKSEPAPIDLTNDATNGVTPAADASVKAKAQAEIKNTRSDLPLMMTDQVAGYITYFSGRGRGVFERAFARSGRYHDMIVSTLKEEGVPQDLIYLAQAESGFHPLAVSRVGARGIWQFMASRGRGYGLHHNMWVDDRQDPEKSTRAAARHLKDLYNQFGDWYLAMAAYNSGPGTVQAAVKRTGYADFWELYRRNVLPKETRNYVPIIMAMTIMTKNPSQYGLDQVAKDRPVDYDSVKISYPVDLRLVAECVNSTPEELQELNPSLLRLTTPREGTFELHLPSGTRDEYATAIAAVPPDMRLWWRYHTVHSGDTLASLARTYHTTAKSIAETNHLESGSNGAELEADAKLVIPVAPGKHPMSDTATYARRITRYKVRAGDTVESVAENFGVSPQMLRRWNGIRGDSLRGRKIVALHLPVSPSTHESEVASSHTKAKHPAAATKPTETAVTKPPATKSAQIERVPVQAAVVHHTVKSGETLYSIARAYRTTVAALKRDNRNTAVLRPGMILIVQSVR